MAGELSDGLISTSSGDEIVKAFKKHGGSDKPRYGSVKVCWAKTQAEAKKTLEKEWPVSALSGRLHVDLATPKHFEDAVEAMGKVEIPEDSVFGPKPEPYLEALQALQENGFDHIYIHQVGPDQEGFLDFFKGTLLPRLEEENLVKT
jgi:coenzyme F420-dependent glucose-6-phosphate dehydrogenase